LSGRRNHELADIILKVNLKRTEEFREKAMKIAKKPEIDLPLAEVMSRMPRACDDWRCAQSRLATLQSVARIPSVSSLCLEARFSLIIAAVSARSLQVTSLRQQLKAPR